MTKYELYLAVHLGTAAVWIGAGFLQVLLGARATLARDPARAIAYAHDSEWLGLRLFLPANLVVAAFGFLLAAEGWDYDQLWIQLGLAGFTLSFLTGSAVFGPGWTKIGKLAASDGVDSPVVHARIRRLVTIAFFDLGVLLAVLFEMTVKPTADDQGALAVTAAIPAAFAVLGILLNRFAQARSPEAALESA